MRETVLSNLASRAATDPVFLRRARKDLEGTLARNGYHLTAEELRLVEDLRLRTAGMSNEQLALTLASGLRGRTGSPRHDPPPRAGAVRAPQDRHGRGVDCSGASRFIAL